MDDEQAVRAAVNALGDAAREDAAGVLAEMVAEDEDANEESQARGSSHV